MEKELLAIKGQRDKYKHDAQSSESKETVENLHLQLKDMQMKIRLQEDKYEKKLGSVNQQWEHKVQLIEKRQTGLSTMDKAHLEEQRALLEEKIRSAERQKVLVEQERDGMDTQ